RRRVARRARALRREPGHHEQPDVRWRRVRLLRDHRRRGRRHRAGPRRLGGAHAHDQLPHHGSRDPRAAVPGAAAPIRRAPRLGRRRAPPGRGWGRPRARVPRRALRVPHRGAPEARAVRRTRRRARRARRGHAGRRTDRGARELPRAAGPNPENRHAGRRRLWCAPRKHEVMLLDQFKRVLVHNILGLDDTPHRIALGVLLGFVIAFTPTLGFQIILYVAVAALLRANKLSGIPILFITNPFTAVPLYWFVWKVGGLVLGRSAEGEKAPSAAALDALFEGKTWAEGAETLVTSEFWGHAMNT